MDMLERIRVVLASPSDLAEEREMIRKLVEELNTISTRYNVYIDLRMWDKAVPALNESGPQGVVDLDLEIPKADIFLCLYWKRVGTIIQQEGVAGTEHELNLALKSFHKNGHPDVKAFFKTVGKADEGENTAYIKGIAHRLQPLGLYSSFESIDVLRSKVNQILHEAVMKKAKQLAPVEPVIAQHFEVSSSKDLISKLAPGNRIILEKGFYDILDFTEQTGYVYKNKVLDGEEAILFGVHNLTIIGDSSSILVRPRYANALTLTRCENVKISGISFGHVAHKGGCRGAAIKLIDCRNIQFDSCEFFGCGTYGLSLQNCSNIVVNGSRIFECTYGGIDMTISDLSFKNSTISECTDLCSSIITIRGGTIDLDNVSICGNSTSENVFTLLDVSKEQSQSRYGVSGYHPAWVLAQGVCVFGNSYSAFSNSYIGSDFFVAENRDGSENDDRE